MHLPKIFFTYYQNERIKLTRYDTSSTKTIVEYSYNRTIITLFVTFNPSCDEFSVQCISRTDCVESPRLLKELENWKENPNIRVKQLFHPISIHVNPTIIFLTSLEINVLNEYENGLSYREIGEKLGKKPKQIDNTIQRIKAKAIQANRRGWA